YASFKGPTGKRVTVATSADSKKAAQRIAVDLERKAERQRHGLEPLPEQNDRSLWSLCEWWLEERCPPQSVAEERSRLRKHVQRAKIADLPLSGVTAQAIESHLRAMGKAGASPASQNNLRKV